MKFKSRNILRPILTKFLSYSFIVILLQFFTTVPNVFSQQFNSWETDTSKKTIDLDELKSGGPPKDGIPAIAEPEFVSQHDADDWLSAEEPVIAFQLNGIERAYPLQILIWHEIVNDYFDDSPVLITFCPLCYSAIVFDRRIDGEVQEFGVSGFLRHSDMVMFDRKTESLWQQFTGEAIVGEYTGKQLEILPSQIISYEQFKKVHPNGVILSKETGHQRPYGKNPYSGYDDINNTPFQADEIEDNRLEPMEKVVGVRINNHQKAYPYSITQNDRVINDELDEVPIVVFHVDGARSALDAPDISNSRIDGSTGAYHRLAEGQTLTFVYDSSSIKDRETGSVWDISGKAISGPLQGEQLESLIFGDYFAFAWLVFWPETKIYSE